MELESLKSKRKREAEAVRKEIMAEGFLNEKKLYLERFKCTSSKFNAKALHLGTLY